MASPFALGILQGVGKSLELGYKKAERARERAWEDQQTDKKFENAKQSFDFQQQYQANLKSLAATSLPFDAYISGQAQSAAKLQGLSGADAVKFSKAWAKANGTEVNRQSYQVQRQKVVTANELFRKQTGLTGPGTVATGGGISTVIPEFTPAGEPFTLTPGAKRFEGGKEIAAVPVAPAKPVPLQRVDILNIETDQEEGTANYNPQTGELSQTQSDGSQKALDSSKYRQYSSGGTNTRGGSNKPFNATFEEARVFTRANNQLVNAIVKANAAINLDETSPAKFKGALLTAFSNVAAETKGLLDLAADTTLGKSFKARKDELINDPTVWENISGVDEDLLAKAQFRDALLTLTFAKLAMNGQTGRDVSANEYQSQLEALAGNMSDGRIVKRKLASLLDDAENRAEDFYGTEIPASHRERIGTEFSRANIRTKINQGRREMGLPLSNFPSQDKTTPTEQDTIKIAIPIVNAYNEAPAELKRQMYDVMPAQIKALVTPPQL